MTVVPGRSLAEFRCDERGSTALLFGLMAMSILVLCGAAVDMGRWLNARTVTVSGLDAAVLAGTRSLQVAPHDRNGAIALATTFYQANVASRLRLENDTIGFRINSDGTEMSATGNAYIQTPLLSFVNVPRLPLFTGADAQYSKAKISVGGNGGSNLEIALMLDVTGSMCDDRIGPCTAGAKISALKTAANDLVNIVVQADQSQHTSRVAIVPFSTRVRVGPDNGGGALMKKLTNLNGTWSGWYKMCTSSSGGGGSEGAGNWTCNAYTSEYETNWAVMPCVTDRFYNSGWAFDATDDAPGAGKWLNGHDGGRMTLSWDSSDAAPTDQKGLTTADPATHWNFSPWGCADIGQPNEIMPLTSDKTALVSRIDALEAYGSTAGALGTAWSWYLLSPKWSGIWDTGNAATGNTPGPYSDLTTLQANGAPKLRKIAVLMTDGGYNTYRGWKDQDQQTVSDYAKQVCANMKAAGVEVYTVAFNLQELSAGERNVAFDTLRTCGTDIHHFYETLNSQQLQQAFRDIALKMSSLHLAQ